MMIDPGARRPTASTGGRFAAALLVCALLLGSGVGIGYAIAQRQAAPVSGEADLSFFWKAWNILDKKFYGETPSDKRIDGAISGMVAGLGDPYTVYLDPEQNGIFQEDLKGSFASSLFK